MVYACGNEVVYQLEFVGAGEVLNGLNLHDQDILDQQVGVEVADNLTGVCHRDGVLLAGDKPGAVQLDSQCVLVDLLQEPLAKLVVDTVCAADDFLGDGVNVVRFHISVALFQFRSAHHRGLLVWFKEFF